MVLGFLTPWCNTVLHFLHYLLRQDNSVAIVQVDFHFTQTIVLYKVNFLTSENLTTIPNENSLSYAKKQTHEGNSAEEQYEQLLTK